ncbi:hypothetical protein V8D89_002236 [Ganoderma adspersum]
MFFITLRAALLGLAATASVVAATPGLTLKVTGTDAVDGVENFKVVVTLTNTGDETFKLLNDPRRALHALPANTFAITSGSGASPRFTGVKVKYSLDYAAQLTDPSVFTVLAPGQSVSITHDLSSAYDFTSTGFSEYTIGASNLFYFVNADNTVSSRADFLGCDDPQQAVVNDAVPAAQKYVTDAHAHLDADADDPGSSVAGYYTTWTVVGHFANVSANGFAAFAYDCSTCADASLYAFVHADDFGVVYLCGAFWGAEATRMDSRAGTLVHEASHFTVNGGTQDLVYGPDETQTLAQSDPDQALMNADNHEFFAEDGQ